MQSGLHCVSERPICLAEVRVVGLLIRFRVPRILSPLAHTRQIELLGAHLFVALFLFRRLSYNSEGLSFLLTVTSCFIQIDLRALCHKNSWTINDSLKILLLRELTVLSDDHIFMTLNIEGGTHSLLLQCPNIVFC